MVGLFKRPYTVRKHGAQVITRGYPSAPHTDVILRLNVQPVAPNRFDAQPEGDRTVKHLKSWGREQLASANEYTSVPGDLLFYRGIWYECKSSVQWDHTLLRHFQSDFVALPANKQPRPPSMAPEPSYTIPLPPSPEDTP